jgi:hypothetical protein
MFVFLLVCICLFVNIYKKLQIEEPSETDIYYYPNYNMVIIW